MENRINHIISRILSGEVLTDDILSFSEWLNEDEKNRREFLRLKSYWDAEISYNHSIDKEIIHEELIQKIRNLERKNKKRGHFVYWLSAVATILVLVIVSFSLFKPTLTIPEPEHIYNYLTENNRTNLVLPDGSHVSLNKYSRLSYSDKYGKEGRKVKLEGEAFFDVCKDSLSVFEVDLGEAVIQVLGTTFNVKCNSDGEEIIATLLEGAIRFRTEHHQLVLQPGQQLVFDIENDHIRLNDVEAVDEILWKDGVMHYRSISFTSLVDELSRHYGVQIALEHPRLKNPSLTITGKFIYDQPLEQVLEVVSRSIPIKWNKKEGIYYIR